MAKVTDDESTQQGNSFDTIPLTAPANPILAALDPKAPAPGTMPTAADDLALLDSAQELLAEDIKQEKYGTLGQQALAGVEGIAEGIAGPLAPLAERALGVDPEDIRGRREANPITHGIGQTAGLVGSMATGVGLGAGMVKAGAAGAKALGVANASTRLGRVGSVATREAIENMVFQSSDEITKMVLQDPNAGAENAIANIGLAGALGGAFGGAIGGTGELWKATSGKKLEKFLEAIKGRANSGTPDPTVEALGALGESVDDLAILNREGQNAIIDGIETSANAQMDNAARTGQSQLDGINRAGQTAREGDNAILDSIEASTIAQMDNAARVGQAQVDGLNRVGQAIDGLANKPDFADRIREGSKVADEVDLSAIKARGPTDGPPLALKQAAGVEIPASLEAALGNNSETRSRHALLQSGTSKAALEVKDDVRRFKQGLSKAAEQSFGLADGDLAAIPNISEATVGGIAGAHLRRGFQDTIDTVAPRFGEFKALAENVPLEVEQVGGLANKLFEAGIEQGWDKIPGSAEHALWKRVMNEMPLQTTAYDIARYATNINNETKRAEMWNAGRVLRGIFREAHDEALEIGLGKTAGGAAAAEFKSLRKDYGRLMNFLEDAGERLGIRGSYGPQEFMSELDNLLNSPEKLLKRLAKTNDVNLGKMLDMVFPDAAETVRNYGKAEILRKALNADRETLNLKALGRVLADLPPEYRERVVGKAATDRIGALEKLERSIPEPFNKSGTGGYIQNMIAKMSPSGVGMAVGMIGGPLGAAAAFTVKKLQEYVQVEGADAVRLVMLKKLATDAPTDPVAFKAAVEFAQNAIKGENIVLKATSAVFKAGSKVLIDSQMPDDKDREKLDKQVTKLQDAPGEALKLAQQSVVGHYMPDQQAAITAASLRALQYLQTLKPRGQKLSPLDREIPPSTMQVARYNRALDIAQTPMIVMDHIQKGTLQPTDLVDLKAMYPALYNRAAMKLTDALMKAVETEENIPYHVRLGISLFLGQPIDSTLTPAGIQGAQSAFMPAQQPQAPGNTGKKPSDKASSAMMKGAKAYQTPGQRAAAARERGDS